MVWYNPLDLFRRYEKPQKTPEELAREQARSRLKEAIDRERELLAFASTARTNGVGCTGCDYCYRNY